MVREDSSPWLAMRPPNAPPGLPHPPVPGLGGIASLHANRHGVAISWDYCAECPCQETRTARVTSNLGHLKLAPAMADSTELSSNVWEVYSGRS